MRRRWLYGVIVLLFSIVLSSCGPILIKQGPRTATPLPAVAIAATTRPTIAPTALPTTSPLSGGHNVLAVSVTPTAEATMTPVPMLPSTLTAPEKRVVTIYQRVSPAVVNVTSHIIQEDFFFGPIPEEGSGSGFLFDHAGHIVTNYHVVESAQSVEVTFSGRLAEKAKIVGTDPENDLAVLLVKQVPADVQPIPLGDSRHLLVGQTVLAIGNPFGRFGRTLTVGVVSALNRTIETSDRRLRQAIQTDAAINRGNSGGPLLDSSGRLVGVNSAIFSPSGTSAGVGFAIPASTVARVVPALIQNGYYPHPWFGAVGYTVTPALAHALHLPVDHGLLVAQLYSDSPAVKAGLHGATQAVVVGNRRLLIGGDLILQWDGNKATSWENLNDYLELNKKPGDTLLLTILRQGKKQVLSVMLTVKPHS